jgi:hypothetical protein
MMGELRMATRPRKRLTDEQRRALELRMRAQRGLTEATLLRLHGFTFELLTDLVRLHLAE